MPMNGERPLLGLFKSSSGTLGMWDGQHEAHFARRGSIGDNCFAANGGAPSLLPHPLRLAQPL
jgi:hypothetical protein